MSNWAEEKAPCLVVVSRRGWSTMPERQEPDEEVQEQIASVLSEPAASMGCHRTERKPGCGLEVLESFSACSARAVLEQFACFCRAVIP